MSEPHEPHDDFADPEVMFLPLAAAPGESWGDLDAGVVSRRIPDFVHQVLNQGQVGPTAMLELQTAADSGPITWVQLDAPPDRDEAFELMPDELQVHAVVSGEVEPVDGGLRLEFHVFRDDDDDEFVTEKIGTVLSARDPVAGLMKLTRRLARLLAIPFQDPPHGLLTSSSRAFHHFLRGLDNAMLLSGDLEIDVPEDRGSLIQPFADAIELDPSFGLALRIANATAALALHGARIDGESVRRFLDRCYSAHPFDGEACVAVAEQLSEMGDEERAFAWLEHATELDPPPSRGLESLGILKVRRGDPAAARGLWEKGLSVDGHPDFFSHLAQLSFAEGRTEDAWDFVGRGLRRLRERTLRAAEWGDAGRGAGVLLECLQAHLTDRTPPPQLAESLLGLRGLLAGDDRVALGLCLFAVGKRREARVELVAGMRAMHDLTARDRAVRAMLQIDVADFEARFAKATERSLRGRNPKPALSEFQLWLHLQPEFWPALYYSAIVKRRLGASDEALDLLAAALEASPGQPDVLFEMAELFARRNNSKRALELVDRALAQRTTEARLHEAKARYLRDLSRPDDARRVVARAITAGLDSPELRRLGRALRRD
ncbi:MAG: tetratricopeptide repeat protein [Planctomycetes bacterium]|nr:tetratricopeptide repeat protein [Planctomycetota bacterium]